MSSHFLSNDYVPRFRPGTYYKHSSRVLRSLVEESDTALTRKGQRSYARSARGKAEATATLERAIACIEAPERQHIVRPRSVKAPSLKP